MKDEEWWNKMIEKEQTLKDIKEMMKENDQIMEDYDIEMFKMGAYYDGNYLRMLDGKGEGTIIYSKEHWEEYKKEKIIEDEEYELHMRGFCGD